MQSRRLAAAAAGSNSQRWRLLVRLLVLCVAFLGWGSNPASAATPDRGYVAEIADEPPLVQRIRFEGNEHFSSGELSRRIRTTRNRRFLGIPGLTWWLWLHQLGDDVVGGRLGDALMTSGEPPAYLSESMVAADVERLENFYEREGFRHAQVDSRIEYLGPERVEVVFHIAAGTPIYNRFVRYDGLEGLTAEQRDQLVEESLLQPVEHDTTGELTFRSAGLRYSEPRLVEERQRILQLLRDEGYATVTRDSIRAFVYPQEPDSFDVAFQVNPGARFQIGDLTFDVRGPEEDAPLRRDTLLETEEGVVHSEITNERRLRTRLLNRSLNVEPGDWYDQSRLLELKRRLDATGVFAFSDIAATPADTAHTAVGPQLRLPHRISLQTRPRHLIRLETFMMQRTGLLSAENEVGMGIGTTYENVNLFGGGEAFRVRTTGSLAADFDFSFFPSAQAEISASLSTPYLIWPFGPLSEALNLYNARTQLSMSLLTARRENLRFILRGRGNTRLRLNMQHSPTLSSLIDIFDVSLSNPDTLRGFQLFLDDLIGPEDDPLLPDPVQRAQIQQDYTEPQVNSALRYTFRSARFHPLRRDEGYSYEMAVEVGNTVPYLLDRYLIEPGVVDYTLPGLPLLGGQTRLMYRPYVRFVTDLRRYVPIGQGEVLATKFIAGLAHPTAEPSLIPFDRRFYSGGASSVRGWALRELRPQTERASVDDAPNLLGGDIKLEASIEARTSFLRQLFGAEWSLAGFVDAGNVWFGPRSPGPEEGHFRINRFYREFGVGTGAGLRLDWDFLILRLDLAHQVHDPLRPGAGLFPDGLARPRLHFGIGQAF